LTSRDETLLPATDSPACGSTVAVNSKRPTSAGVNGISTEAVGPSRVTARAPIGNSGPGTEPSTRRAVIATATDAPASPDCRTSTVTLVASPFFITGGDCRSAAMSTAIAGPRPTVKQGTPSRSAASTADGPEFSSKSLITTSPCRLEAVCRARRSRSAAPMAVTSPRVVRAAAARAGSTVPRPSSSSSSGFTPSGPSNRNALMRNFSASRLTTFSSVRPSQALRYSTRAGVEPPEAARPVAAARRVRSSSGRSSWSVMLSEPSTSSHKSGRET